MQLKAGTVNLCTNWAIPINLPCLTNPHVLFDFWNDAKASKEVPLCCTLYSIESVKSWSPSFIWIWYSQPWHLTKVLLKGLLWPAKVKRNIFQPHLWIKKMHYYLCHIQTWIVSSPVSADKHNLKLVARFFYGPVGFHQDSGQTAAWRTLQTNKGI